MKNIILDTDFLINCAKLKIDFSLEISKILDTSFKLFIIDKTIDELQGKKYEKLVKAIIEAEKISFIETKKDKSVDDLILENVNENTIVATQDQELKRRLKNKGIKIITIRQKKYLVLI